MGITFDIEQQKFQIDFEHDGTSDLITLTGSGYQVEAFFEAMLAGRTDYENLQPSTLGLKAN